ncbi:suppressor of SWI4 1 homolog b [Xenopus laevis]|uniref:Suppressor of SWI4 1 homolog b n=1 Tax=Xenopus laevis TaxID=8355 RepID=Q5U260_XENLA|nr:suppressor of SWI4 1 homolog b [Xenopus laevis]AAH86267.1 Unknown (protein for MGC:81614) [Xenopus laevis]
MGKDKTKNQKKQRAAANHNAEEDFNAVPHSFVFHRGQIGKNVQQLITDVRRAMEPFTARSLKVRKKNALKDFVAVAGPLGVTHFLIFTKTSTNVNFKFVRLPKGPTLSFKVTQYSLVKDVVSSLKKHRMHEEQFSHPPLLVLNNFGTQGMHVKLMATMFQNMFPSINVHKVTLNTIRRCILINYNDETQELEFRHYSLKVVPVGMSKGMKKLLQEKFPNMSRWEDISELLVKGANLSESEAEQDGDHNITELPQACAGRGNMKAQQSAVRLTEIGPRMTLQLVKIEEGLSDGKVLFHNFIQKTEEEIKALLESREKKVRQKKERKKKQEGDVERKKNQKEENKKRSLAGMKRKHGDEEGSDSEVEDPGTLGEQNPADQSEDDDAEYYRQEVGEEPDKDLFLHSKKKSSYRSGPPRKKFKGSGREKLKSDRRGEHDRPHGSKSPSKKHGAGVGGKEFKSAVKLKGQKFQGKGTDHKAQHGGKKFSGNKMFGSKSPRPGFSGSKKGSGFNSPRPGFSGSKKGSGFNSPRPGFSGSKKGSGFNSPRPGFSGSKKGSGFNSPRPGFSSSKKGFGSKSPRPGQKPKGPGHKSLEKRGKPFKQRRK